jgi:hypothetical protein
MDYSMRVSFDYRTPGIIHSEKWLWSYCKDTTFSFFI